MVGRSRPPVMRRSPHDSPPPSVCREATTGPRPSRRGQSGSNAATVSPTNDQRTLESPNAGPCLCGEGWAAGVAGDSASVLRREWMLLWEDGADAIWLQRDGPRTAA